MAWGYLDLEDLHRRQLRRRRLPSSVLGDQVSVEAERKWKSGVRRGLVSLEDEEV